MKKFKIAIVMQTLYNLTGLDDFKTLKLHPKLPNLRNVLKISVSRKRVLQAWLVDLTETVLGMSWQFGEDGRVLGIIMHFYWCRILYPN